MNVGRFFLFAIPFTIACVSNGDTSTKPQGSLGGPCFANNTCNAGLDCILENGSGICEQPDATVADAPNDVVGDQSTNDVTTNDASDGGADAEAGCTASLSHACPNFDCHGQAEECCANLGTCGLNSADCNGQPLWQCVKGGDCASNFPCCLTATISNANACPPTGQAAAGSTCATGNSCGSDFQLCESSSECGGKVCTAVSLGGISANVGLCM